MRIIKEHDERRNEILDAAELLFATKGYADATVNDILQKVGIAKGTFYYYFKSKEEVMNAIVMRFIDAGMIIAKAIASDPNLTALEKMYRIITSLNQDTGRKEQMIEQMHKVNNAEMHQKSIVETILQLTPILTSVVEQGNEEGSFKVLYPKETTEFMLVASQVLLDAGIFQWTQEEISQKIKAFVYIMEMLLGTEKGSFNYIAQKYENCSSE